MVKSSFFKRVVFCWKISLVLSSLSWNDFRVFCKPGEIDSISKSREGVSKLT